MNTNRALVALAAAMLLGSVSQGAIIFSYDAATGQLPTDQGWSGFETDTTGPLTAANTSGTAANNANAAIEVVDGINTLHLRDSLTDSTADLPNFYYPWSVPQQQALIDGGLRFTLVVQSLTNTASNGNVRVGFNGTEFETQMDNIAADQTIQVLGFGAGAFPIDGQFHTLVITGQKNGTNFDFSYAVDGGASTALSIVTNPAPTTIQSSVYFGGFSSAGRNTDLLVRSAVMETIVPEPSAIVLALLGAIGIAAVRRLRQSTNVIEA